MNVVVVPLLSHVWLCDLLDCSMPGFPVLHHFPEFAQTHVHWVGDAIQLSHPLSPLLLNSIFPTLIWNVIIFVYLLDIYTHTHTHTQNGTLNQVTEPAWVRGLISRQSSQTQNVSSNWAVISSGDGQDLSLRVTEHRSWFSLVLRVLAVVPELALASASSSSNHYQLSSFNFSPGFDCEVPEGQRVFLSLQSNESNA